MKCYLYLECLFGLFQYFSLVELLVNSQAKPELKSHNSLVGRQTIVVKKTEDCTDRTVGYVITRKRKVVDESV